MKDVRTIPMNYDAMIIGRIVRVAPNVGPRTMAGQGAVSSVVLASHGKHARDYVGCACLRQFRDISGEPVEGALEVCYLFVAEPFRWLKIARSFCTKLTGPLRSKGIRLLSIG